MWHVRQGGDWPKKFENLCSNLTLRTIFLLLYVDNNFIVDNHLKDINFVEFNIQTEREYFKT